MNFFKKSLSTLFSVSLLALPFLVWWKFQAINDWWKLRGYDPPAEIVKLADSGAMTAGARRIFYVNHPKLQKDINQFRRDCPQSEQTIVLGCYRSPQQGIAIYDINDTRLPGVEEVTAAHEMLHAAYDRLDQGEKDRINNLLTSQYNQLADSRIKQTIDLYQKTEPKDVSNEMHSIFATEVAQLPPELDKYYSRYFTNRLTIVTMAQAYEAEFSNRLEQIAQYDRQTAALKLQIDQQEKILESQLALIESERQRIDRLRASGNIDNYNSSVAQFNSRVNAYNQGVARLKRYIADYNELVSRRNAIAIELKSLDKALDTRLTPQSSR